MNGYPYVPHTVKEKEKECRRLARECGTTFYPSPRARYRYNIKIRESGQVIRRDHTLDNMLDLLLDGSIAEFVREWENP